MSTLEVNKITPQGTATEITLGDSGDTFTIPSGVTLTNNGTASGFGANTPAFRVTRPSNQTLTDAANTKVQFNSEDFDTDNCFDSSTNYRFTPTTAGKYVISTAIRFLSDDNNRLATTDVLFFKNGSNISNAPCNYRHGQHNGITLQRTDIITFNGTTDYLEVYANGDVDSGGIIVAGGQASILYGYLLVGA
jgi:hypothetical protein